MKLIRRSTLSLLFTLSILATMLLIYPVRNGITRPAILLIFPVIYGLILSILWRRRLIRYPLIIVPGIVVLLVALPGRRFNPVDLQAQYLSSLRSYEGTSYVWGGENHLGVDCSGLIRAAMVDAELYEGLRRFNPRLLREGCWLWWHDIAARDMPGGYAGRMETLFSSDAVRQSGIERLQPGDVAITGDGSHVIAYLGGDRWIEADPVGLRVSEWSGQERPESINRPMVFVRWTIFQ